jgi:hypothetical protein
VEESNRRRERATSRSEGSREAAERIAAGVVVSVAEGLVVVSPQRPSLRRDDGMEQLESTTWLGRGIALQGLLELVSKMSLSMQTVNVIPWELMTKQCKFYDKLVAMHAAIRDQPSESDPRWSSTPSDPIPVAVFPFFHEEPDKKTHPGVSRINMLMSETYMGQELKMPEADRREGITEKGAYVEAAFDLSYDVANWLSVRLTSFRFVVVDAIATVAIDVVLFVVVADDVVVVAVAAVVADAPAATADKNLRDHISRFAS